MGLRSKYFIKHLLFSVFIASISIILIFLFWYPQPLDEAIGVNKLIIILITIDVIIGPILSFIVYKEGKKTLFFDLSVIVLLQISALTYGIYTIAEGRPVWIVYYKNSFELIRANEIIIQDKSSVAQKYKKNSWFGPEYVAVKVSDDPNQRSDDLFMELGGVSVAQLPERYLSINTVQNDLKSYAQPLSELNKVNSDSSVVKIIDKYPKAKYWYPLKASVQDMIVLVDQNYNVIKIVDLHPWN